MKRNVPISAGNKPLVDIFDEKDSISIITQVPTSVDQSQHEVLYKNGILKVGLEKRKNNGTDKGKRRKEDNPQKQRKNSRKARLKASFTVWVRLFPASAS